MAARSPKNAVEPKAPPTPRRSKVAFPDGDGGYVPAAAPGQVDADGTGMPPLKRIMIAEASKLPSQTAEVTFQSQFPHVYLIKGIPLQASTPWSLIVSSVQRWARVPKPRAPQAVTRGRGKRTRAIPALCGSGSTSAARITASNVVNVHV